MDCVSICSVYEAIRRPHVSMMGVEKKRVVTLRQRADCAKNIPDLASSLSSEDAYNNKTELNNVKFFNYSPPKSTRPPGMLNTKMLKQNIRYTLECR